MRTLCIDTSVFASIAVVEEGTVLAQVADENPRHHAEGLGDLLIQSLTAAGLPESPGEAQFGRIVVGTGPAPYTALRAGLAFSSALGRGLGIPVLGVPSLDGLGEQAAGLLNAEGRHGSALVLTDAKRSEVYSGLYRVTDGGHANRVAGPTVGSLEDAVSAARLEDAEVTLFYCGQVPKKLKEALESLSPRFLAANSSELAEVADLRFSEDPDTEFPLEPLYLRRPDIN